MKETQDITEKKPEKLDNADAEISFMDPPDGGWGWLVVFASFMCNVIVDGIILTFGIFLKVFTETFSANKAKIAWVGSLQAGCYLMAGPIVSGLANTYGCRPVTIAGSIIASVAFGISYFATSIDYLIVSMGLLSGIGFGFIFLPAIVTVGFYFEQKRALATGIAVCGSGVGAFAFAPLIRDLVDYYGWQGCLLILSGFVLNCAFFGSFFRPLEPVRKKTICEEKPLLLRIKEARDLLKNWDSEESVRDSLYGGQNASNGHAFGANWRASVDETHIPNSIRSKSFACHSSGGSNTESTVSQTESNSSPPPSYSEVVSSDMLPCLRPTQYNSLTRRPYGAERRSPSRQLRKGSCQPEMLRPFYRQDILFSASLIRLPEFRSQPDMKHYHTSITRIPPEDESAEQRWCSAAMTDTFRQMLDLSLLTSPTFLLLASSGFLTLAGFFVPFTYIVDRATEIGISEREATFLLSVIGITNTIGRVFSGWLSDRPNINALLINNCALTVGGAATAISPFLNSYPLLLTYCAVFGFSIACFAALRSIIAVELLGLEKLTNAFGLLLLFQGMATIVGSPIAGFFYDLTGTYDASFYIAGSVICVSGLMCFALPCLSRWENRRKSRTQSVPPEVVVTDSGIDV